MSIDFAIGLLTGMVLTVFGLVAFEHYDMWQERKRRKKDGL